VRTATSQKSLPRQFRNDSAIVVLRLILAFWCGMATRRLFAPGLSHHVWHRGNNRTTVFRDDGDRTVFLLLLGRAAQRLNVQIHGYALMDTHYHTLLTAPDEAALPRMMQHLGRDYVRHFNGRHERSGTLWEGRYCASLILDERRWLTCLRYIELNPVEANIVDTPDAYRWSSYRHHALGEADRLLSTHSLLGVRGSTAEQQQNDWRVFCGQGSTVEEKALILAALRSNGPLHEPGCPQGDGTDAVPLVTQT
jgi:putative transposase